MKTVWLPLALIGFLAGPLILCAAAQPAAKADYLVYFGTYTGKGSKGIYVSRLDSATGKLSAPELAAEAGSPSFLAIHPARDLLYAVGEGGKPGGVSAFSMDRGSGRLTLLNQVSSVGRGPCHITVDRTGKYVLIANYGDGTAAVFPIHSDGSLGAHTAFVEHKGSSVNPKRQAGPHAHSVNMSPDNRFAFVADLGLDKVLIYRFDPAKGSLEPNEPAFAAVAPGAGPRHFAFHPGGKFAYVINELASTVTAFTYTASRGVLKEAGTVSTLPKDFTGENSTAEVQVHPSGRFLYGSNRGHDSIAVFSIDPGKGTLKPIEHVSTQGKVPRNFGIDPAGDYLLAANQNSGTVAVFRIDRKTGRLTPTGQVLEVPTPVCVKFVPVK